MELNPGSPEQYDILLEISSSAIEYFCKAETEEETHERLREIMHLQPTPEKYFRMTVENDRSPEVMEKFFYNGFMFWLKRMGFAG